MDTEEKMRILAKVAAKLNGAHITYAVGASAMLYLRGITDGFHDIDLTVAEDDAPRAVEALCSLGVMAPPEHGDGRLTRCFREYEIDGAEVDLIAGMVIVSDGAAHECPLRAEDIDTTVPVCGVPVPLHSLECWRRYYTLMGRTAKVVRIERALERCSAVPASAPDQAGKVNII